MTFYYNLVDFLCKTEYNVCNKKYGGFFMAHNANKAIRLNISIRPDLLEKLDSACDSIGASRSAYIALAIQAKLASDAMLEKVPEFVTSLATIAEMAKLAEHKNADGTTE